MAAGVPSPNGSAGRSKDRWPAEMPGRVIIDERAAEAAQPGRTRRRVRLTESFHSPRLRSRTGPWRRIRSTLLLIVVTVFVAAIVSGVLAAIVGGIAIAIQHASNA